MTKIRFAPATFVKKSSSYVNPFRGWYRIYSFDVSGQADLEELKWSMYEGETLALVLLDIGAFADKPIGSQGLFCVQEILGFFASVDRDMIVRVVYDRVGKGLLKEPAFLSTVKMHMVQLGPIFFQYAKDIYTLQGIFVGAYGEMHESKFLSPWQIKDLIQTLWAACGGSCTLAVRKPCQWRMLYDAGEEVNIPVGLFDDGLFGSPLNMGTFGAYSREMSQWHEPWLREDEMEFQNILCRHVPHGGEAPYGLGYQYSASFYLDFMKRTKLSYLNCVYDERVLNNWKALGIYDYIGEHLGYRLFVKEAVYKKKGGFSLEVLVENQGFAPYYGLGELELIYQEKNGEMIRFLLEEDLSVCLGGESLKIIILKRPKKIAIYDVYLRLKDLKTGKIISFANEGAKERVHLGTLLLD